MNWYRLSQQQSFPFYDPKIDGPIQQENALLNDRHTLLTETNIEELIEYGLIQDEQELRYALQQQNISYDYIDDFPSASPIYVIYGKNGASVIDFASQDIIDATEWINSISEMYLEEYVTALDANEGFWSGVGPGYKLYHGTHEEHINDILNKGIEARDVTRGTSNRNTGSAVFMSPDPETARSYYDKVVEIDIGQMKADGYMPQAGGEEPLEEGELRNALASKIGLDDYYWEIDSSDGLDPGTVIFHGEVPARYIREV
jgi:hypothetical protein